MTERNLTGVRKDPGGPLSAGKSGCDKSGKTSPSPARERNLTGVTVREPPVRLCCGERHWGVVCPDGKIMCCLCFDRFTVEELSVTVDGDKQDVCRACAEYERQR